MWECGNVLMLLPQEHDMVYWQVGYTVGGGGFTCVVPIQAPFFFSISSVFLQWFFSYPLKNY